MENKEKKQRWFNKWSWKRVIFWFLLIVMVRLIVQISFILEEI